MWLLIVSCAQDSLQEPAATPPSLASVLKPQATVPFHLGWQEPFFLCLIFGETGPDGFPLTTTCPSAEEDQSLSGILPSLLQTA